MAELGVIFDWDGVMVDSHDQHEWAWERLGAELGKPLPPGFFAATFGMRNEQIIPGYTGWAAAGDDAAIAELGRRKEELYRARLRDARLEPLPGAAELVEALAAAGVPCAIGSSTPRQNLDVILEMFGWRQRFAAIVAAEDVRCGKPDPEVFVTAAQRLGRPPQRCVVFEDAPPGIAAARAAGTRVVALTTTHPAATFSGVDAIVASLAEFSLADIEALF